jgi:hypothetical protein
MAAKSIFCFTPIVYPWSNDGLMESAKMQEKSRVTQLANRRSTGGILDGNLQ